MLTASSIDTTIFFAAIFGLLHVVFTLRVGGYRFRNRISLGDGGDDELLKRIRAHGNFTENVPIGLLLLLLNELNGLAENYLIALGSVFLMARVMHYITIVSKVLPLIFRPISMVLTLGTIAVSAILLLV